MQSKNPLQNQAILLFMNEKKLVKQAEYGILISWGDKSDPQIPSTSQIYVFLNL